ncbi:MAG: A/G-specific adenine glycosylase [Peptococcaceae bacterium]|jgi:A/G-specific adenine glycosylase|nr:A/G-specific adenine glycosylase [Peptococcaceae bacterium]
MDRFKEAGEILCRWYEEFGRDLPWRKRHDSYAIWISEIMLQQTRVDTVIAYYERFLERFPDIFSLAQADESDILAMWQGLGYYPRARNIYRAAQIVVEKYDRVFPSSFKVISSFPGIGEYTAGAIVSIAYNQSYPAVDGNAIRVISRWEGLAEDPSKDKLKKKIGVLMLSMMPEGRAGDFNQAVMDLGATVCIPGEPSCASCPLQPSCEAFASDRQNELPLKRKAVKKPEPLPYGVVVVRKDDQLLMEFRQDETLLGKMWGFPMVKIEKRASKSPSEEILHVRQLFQEKYRLELSGGNKIGRILHIFTHQMWEMEVLEFSLEPSQSFPAGLYWISSTEIKNLPVPTAFYKVLRLLS